MLSILFYLNQSVVGLMIGCIGDIYGGKRALESVLHQQQAMSSKRVVIASDCKTSKAKRNSERAFLISDLANQRLDQIHQWMNIDTLFGGNASALITNKNY